MVTMRQIAEELNLSRSTVSYALHERWRSKRVGPDTRQRILDRAAALGYRRNHAAVSLKTRQTQTIGVIAPTVASDFVYQMLHGAETALQDDYTLLLGTSAWEASKEQRLIESFEERRVDGMLIIHAGHAEIIPALKRLITRGVPVVQVEHGFAQLESDVVQPDNEGLSYTLTRHLLDLGHRQICFIRSPRVHHGTLDRAKGYERAIREAGLAAHVFPVLPIDSRQPRFDFVSGLTRKALQTISPPLGIVTNDLVSALGALQAVEDAGLRCPDDVSICATTAVSDSAAIESNPVHRFLRVRFTTFEWSVEEMGRRAAMLLLDRLQNPQARHAPFQKISIPGRLIVGDSTARPPFSNAVQPHSK